MRSFLYLAVLYSLISFVNASCASFKCPQGLIIGGNGSTVHKDGSDGLNTTSNNAGCILVINNECTVASEPMPSPFNEEYFDRCVHTDNNDAALCNHKEDVDFHYPSYSVEFFDKVIKETGYRQCKHLRSRFAQWEKERESCFTKTELLITVLCTVGGFILICIAACVGGGIACHLRSKRRQRPPAPPMVSPGMMGPGMCPAPPPMM